MEDMLRAMGWANMATAARTCEVGSRRYCFHLMTDMPPHAHSNRHGDAFSPWTTEHVRAASRRASPVSTWVALEIIP